MTTIGAWLITIGAGAVLAAGIAYAWWRIHKSVWKPLPYVDEAERYLWTSVYGQPEKRMPSVWYVPADGSAGEYGWTDRWGRKVAGQSMFEANAINVGFPREGGKLHRSALAYEMARIMRYQQGRSQYDDRAATASDKAEMAGAELRGRQALEAWERGRA